MEQERGTGLKIQTECLKCCGGNVTKLFCINKNCNNMAMLCSKEECQCGAQHQNCQYFRADSLIKRLEAKKKELGEDTRATIKTMEKVYDDAIDKLSRDKERLQDQMELFGLSDDQAFLVRLINDHCFTQIKGSTLAKIMPKIGDQIQFFVNQEDIQIYWKIYKEKFETIFNNLKAIPIRPRHKLISKIVDSDLVLKLFFDTPVIGFKLLYRASENNFSAHKFRQICNGVKNTLVLARTEFDRIIGGFTHVQWNSSTTNYVPDNQKRNFLFSVSLKEKYSLVSSQHAIYNNPNFGPVFGGGHDLCIGDNSATADNISYSKIGHSYNLNGKYKSNIAGGFTQFSGATVNQYVKFPEWEVFQVQFI